MTDFQVEVGGRDEGWNSNCLVKFNQCLGMPTEGFEEEILYLLRRMKGIIDQKGHNRMFRKAKSLSSKFDKEPKKLEWTASYKKTKVDTELGKSSGASVSRCK